MIQPVSVHSCAPLSGNTSRKKRDRNGSETAGKRKAKNNIKQQILCGGVKAVSWKLRRMNVLLGTENKQKEAA